jgi:hypothetical protein
LNLCAAALHLYVYQNQLDFDPKLLALTADVSITSLFTI